MRAKAIGKLVLLLLLAGIGCGEPYQQTTSAPMETPSPDMILAGKMAAVISPRTDPPATDFPWPIGYGGVIKMDLGTREEVWIHEPGSWACPQWSPAGANLALTDWNIAPEGQDPYGHEGMLHVGSEELTRTNSCAFWSSDGKRLLFSYHGGLYTIDIITKEQTGIVAQLMPGGEQWTLDDWSPDGRRILISREKSISEMRLDGSEERSLVQNRFCGGARYSPDGTEIVFWCASTRTKSFIYRMSLSDSSEIKVGEGEEPQWSPDGTQIAFLLNDALYVTSIDGSARTYIAGGTKWAYGSFSWGR